MATAEYEQKKMVVEEKLQKADRIEEWRCPPPQPCAGGALAWGEAKAASWPQRAVQAQGKGGVSPSHRPAACSQAAEHGEAFGDQAAGRGGREGRAADGGRQGEPGE